MAGYIIVGIVTFVALVYICYETAKYIQRRKQQNSKTDKR